MAKVTYLHSPSPRDYDNWVAGRRITEQESICLIEPIRQYIANVFSHPEAEQLVTQHATQTFESHTPDDYEQAGERLNSERISQNSALYDEQRAIKKKARTNKRITKYGNTKSHPWNLHERFLYLIYVILPLFAFAVSMAVVTSIILSSGLFAMFTEHPMLAILVSSAPILGGALFKAGSTLFSTEKNKNLYMLALFVITLVSLTTWLGTFSSVFKEGGSNDLFSAMDAANESSLTYQLWVVSQLCIEMLGGAFLALVAQKKYREKLVKEEEENPTYIGVLEDEREAFSQARQMDNRIGGYKNYRNRVEQAKQKFINESLAILHDYQEKAHLASMQSLQATKAKIRADLSEQPQLNLISNN